MTTLHFAMGHPVGWVNPVTFRASAVLPAAGAWDATPTEQNVAGASALRLSLTYTRGAGGGAFEFQVESSIYAVVGNVPAGASEWVTEPLFEVDTIAAGTDATSLVQRESVSYTSTAAGAEDFFMTPIDLAGIERIRIRARETGVVGTPGTLSIVGELQP